MIGARPFVSFPSKSLLSTPEHVSVSNRYFSQAPEKAETKPYTPPKLIKKPQKSIGTIKREKFEHLMEDYRKNAYMFFYVKRERDIKKAFELRQETTEKQLKKRQEREAHRTIRAAERTKVGAVVEEQKRQLREYRHSRYKAYESVKSEARKEFIKILEEDMNEWIYSPSELAWRRFYVSRGLEIEGTKLKNWIQMGMGTTIKKPPTGLAARRMLTMGMFADPDIDAMELPSDRHVDDLDEYDEDFDTNDGGLITWSEQLDTADSELPSQNVVPTESGTDDISPESDKILELLGASTLNELEAMRSAPLFQILGFGDGDMERAGLVMTDVKYDAAMQMENLFERYDYEADEWDEYRTKEQIDAIERDLEHIQDNIQKVERYSDFYNALPQIEANTASIFRSKPEEDKFWQLYEERKQTINASPDAIAAEILVELARENFPRDPAYEAQSLAEQKQVISQEALEMSVFQQAVNLGIERENDMAEQMEAELQVIKEAEEEEEGEGEEEEGEHVGSETAVSNEEGGDEIDQILAKVEKSDKQNKDEK